MAGWTCTTGCHLGAPGLRVAFTVSLLSEVYYSAGLVPTYPHFFGAATVAHLRVHRRRVEEVRRRLADPGTKHLNILALGLDAGFASKSTFTRRSRRSPGRHPPPIGRR